MAPFFTIGLTTYDRDSMLRETLDSILAQTFSDYEVIVSNDNPARHISGQSIGILDPRFKFVNQRDNLGELANMNYLLRQGAGNYFTWLADDDLYAPDFLESVHRVSLKYSYPKCIFTSFRVFKGERPEFDNKDREGSDELFDGPGFLYRHSKGEANAISTMGFFDRKTIRDIGGLEDISGDGKGMFCEYMLLVKTIMLDKVAYINRPLVFFRFHKGCWGGTSTDLDMYKRAADNLTRKSIEIFRDPRFRKYFHSYLYFILNLSVFGVLGAISRCRKTGDRSVRPIIAYLARIKQYIDQLKGSELYLIGLAALIHVEMNVLCSSARFAGRGFMSAIRSSWQGKKREKDEIGAAA